MRAILAALAIVTLAAAPVRSDRMASDNLCAAIDSALKLADAEGRHLAAALLSEAQYKAPCPCAEDQPPAEER